MVRCSEHEPTLYYTLAQAVGAHNQSDAQRYKLSRRGIPPPRRLTSEDFCRSTCRPRALIPYVYEDATG